MMNSACVVILAIASLGQDPSVEKQALAVAQQASVHTLDKSLEDKPFVDWFKALVGNSAPIVWDVSDCGEGDGRGGQVRDAPMCGKVVANLTSTKKVVVQLLVGSRSKGASAAALWSAAILDGNDVRFFRTLPELAAAVRAK
jgi:hypothetical protein